MNTTVVAGRDLEEITTEAVLTRGLGRSYGDASLPPTGRGPVASSLLSDRVLSFDESTGQLRVEAGMRLGRLIDLFLPRGFFVPVTPGTRDVTIGGMIAADVHGKNHHVAGTIGAHVQAIRMRLADGRIEEVHENSSPELFCATLGGMGLTGHILDVTLTMERVPSRFVLEETRTFSDLESLIDGLMAASAASPYSVAWSDFLAPAAQVGRGIILTGRWASAQEAASAVQYTLPTVTIPWPMPERLLSNTTIRAFNAFRYELARSACRRGPKRTIRSAESFFYPLDALRNWNLLYGRRGLTQYQCVVPKDPSMRSYRRLAEVARGSDAGPFLAVIKDCGDQGKGSLSFPMPGISFALDFPIGEETTALVSQLNAVVQEAGGRVYLAKDAFSSAEQIEKMDPRMRIFATLRDRLDPNRKIDSALARRVFR